MHVVDKSNIIYSVFMPRASFTYKNQIVKCFGKNMLNNINNINDLLCKHNNLNVKHSCYYILL